MMSVTFIWSALRWTEFHGSSFCSRDVVFVVVDISRRFSMRAEVKSCFRNTDRGFPSARILERRCSAEIKLSSLTLSPWCGLWGQISSSPRSFSSDADIDLTLSSYSLSLSVAGIITIRRTLCPSVMTVFRFRTVRTLSRPAPISILPMARIRLELWDSGRTVEPTWRWRMKSSRCYRWGCKCTGLLVCVVLFV